MVAKLLIRDSANTYLLLYRINHPTFGFDPDLPGGTLDNGETLLETMVREVQEEVGVSIDAQNVRELYAGTEYSAHGTHYSLFTTQVNERPKIVLSWEHSSYEWLAYDDFLKKTKNAKDTYMQMVSDIITRP